MGSAGTDVEEIHDEQPGHFLEEGAGHPGLAKLLDEGQQAVVFDAALSEIQDVNVPWYYFSGGIRFTLDGVRYRFSFARPANTADAPDVADSMQDISKARRSGKVWKEILMDHDSSHSGKQDL